MVAKTSPLLSQLYCGMVNKNTRENYYGSVCIFQIGNFIVMNLVPVLVLGVLNYFIYRTVVRLVFIYVFLLGVGYI